MTRKLAITPVRATFASVGLAAASMLFVPTVARADETNLGSDGVVVTVEITPRACVPNCAGGGNGGTGTGGGLPATGMDLSPAILWIAVALVAFGILLLLQRRRVRAAAGSLQIPPPSGHTMATGVITSHARPSQPRRTKTGGSRETDDPDIG